MYVKQLAKACEDLFDLNTLVLSDAYYYSSLPLCVIDAVFSIGVKYTSTENTVHRYCKYFNIERYRDKTSSIYKDYQNISQMIENMESLGVSFCTENIFCNRQRTSPTNGILKAEAVLLFAKVLKKYGIETLNDLQQKGLPSEAEIEIKKIPGQKSGLALQYFYMLAGDDSLAKPDRHILRFINKFTGLSPSAEDAQNLLSKTVEHLNPKYPNITVRLLDYTIWDYMAHPPTETKTITHNKLVRDRIPEIIEASGKICKTAILDNQEYLRMIDAKLDEELAEYHQDQNIEELADLLEVIYAAAQARGYTLEDLEATRKEKADKRGSFSKKILLREVIEP